MRILPLAIRRPAPSRPEDAPADHPIDTPEAQRLWWGHESKRREENTVPSVRRYAIAVLDLRRAVANEDAAFWLKDLGRQLDDLHRLMDDWRQLDNAEREACFHNVSLARHRPVWPDAHPDPLVARYIALVFYFNACVRQAIRTSRLLRRHGEPDNHAVVTVRETLNAIARVPQRTVQIQRSLLRTRDRTPLPEDLLENLPEDHLPDDVPDAAEAAPAQAP